MLRWLNVIALAGTVAVNALANAAPIAGVRTEDVSQKYQHLFSPADYAFAIWGVIYVLLALFAAYQAQKKHADIAEKCGPWFIVNCIANALWMICWHYELLALSVVCMGGIVWSLAVMNIRLETFGKTWKEKLLVQAGLSLYFGWACVAAAANAGSFLVQARFGGLGISPEAWTAALAVLLALVSMAVLDRLGNLFFGIAAAWGLIGVMAQHYVAYGMRYGLAIAGLVLALLMVLVKMRQLTAWENYRWRAE